MQPTNGRNVPTRSTTMRFPITAKAEQTTTLNSTSLSRLHRVIRRTNSGNSRLNQISTPTDHNTGLEGGINPCGEKTKSVDRSPPSSRYHACDPADDLAWSATVTRTTM